MIKSRTFKFIFGIDEVPIVAHEAAIADQSPALATIIQGQMLESLAGEV
jgi:hypothetical protein